MNGRDFTFTAITADGARSAIRLQWHEVVARVAEFIRSGDYTTETLRNSRRISCIRTAGGEVYVTSNGAAPGSMAGVSSNDTTEALGQALARQF